MSVWYYLEKGRPRGPVNTDFILAELRAGRLHGRDLLYRETDTQWRELKAFAEFQKSIDEKKDAAGARDKKDKGHKKDDLWVLLARKPEGGGYRQKGPFTTTEIVRKLKDGKVTVTDYIWREGLKEWYKILAVPEIKERLFDTEQVTRTIGPISVPVPKSISDVMTPPELPPQREPSEAPAPIDLAEAPTLVTTRANLAPAKKPEVSNTDITVTASAKKSDAPIKPQVTATKKIRPGRAAPKNRLYEKAISGFRIGPLRYFLDLPPVRRAAVAAVTIAAIVGFVGFVFWYSTYLDRKNLHLERPKVTQVPPSTLPPKPVAEMPIEKAAAPLTPPAKIVLPKIVHPPTYVRVQKTGSGSLDPVLQIITDASPQYIIQLNLSADGGYVLGRPSVFTERIVRTLEGRSVHLGHWHIPWGIYRYHVQCEDKAADGVVYVGTAQADWVKKIRQQRKDEIFEHNIERVSFIKTADHMASVTAKLAEAVNQPLTTGAWRSFYHGWRMEFNRVRNPVLSRINDRSRNNYLHPTQWISLRDLRKDIDETSKEVNRSRQEKADSGREYAKLKSQLRHDARLAESLKETMIRTSIMR